MRLVLLRHGESEWNLENRFTGWTDVDLSANGRVEAREAGRLLREAKLDFDICYTSYLKRAIHTLNIVLEALDREWLPAVKSWELNERHYGALQGLNKAETAAKYGEEQVHLWRRSFATRPPALAPDDPRNPMRLAQYREIDPKALPLTKSLQDTIARTVPYYEREIQPWLRDGKRVLIAAHGNSLRALVMYLEGLSEEAIAEVNLPTGVPLVYALDDSLAPASKVFLGNPDTVAARIGKAARPT
ncbi:2,3-diphosphoglycerate-dependent phosphoglycerate mutase [Eubacteriales bacterium OttesenSCG-928-A19]|nr:2,3-diphosphoglycerate-dependent phosphoglycerate mutase [Eubacteriales bacterium OttesenSCG-928-A19]